MAATKKKPDTQLAEATPKKPTKGRGGNSNFPNAKFKPETDEDRELVRKLLNETLVAYRQERVKSDNELIQRIDDYFQHCGLDGVTPTVEEMSLYTGYTSATLYDWEVGRNKGFSAETSTIIKKAKEVLKTFDAKLVISGKMNFLAYCFRAKNYYGMADKQEVVLSSGNALGEQLSDSELQKKYLEDAYGGATIEGTATIVDTD